MSRALAYEWTRLRTLWSTWWLLGTCLAVSAGVAAIFAGVSRGHDYHGLLLLSLTALAGQVIPVQALLTGLVGAFAIGHEYRYGTIRATLPVVPRRGALLTAKAIVVAAWSVVIGVASLATASLVLLAWPGARVLQDPVSSSVLVRVLTGFVLIVVLYGLIGLALSGLLRNLPGSIVLLVLWPLLVEPIITGLTFIPGLTGLRGATRFLPFGAARRLLVGTSSTGGGPPGVHPLGPWQGGGLLAALAVVLVLVWALAFRRRDA